jgi:hypothetical protein
MTLASWEAKGWLYSHRTSKNEVQGLLQLVEHDLLDARRDLPAEWRFSISFSAALNLCKTILVASGYRADAHCHERTIQALPLVLGEKRQTAAEYLNSCLVKRNRSEPDQHDPITAVQANELTRFAEELQAHVKKWLQDHYPVLVA